VLDGEVSQSGVTVEEPARRADLRVWQLLEALRTDVVAVAAHEDGIPGDVQADGAGKVADVDRNCKFKDFGRI
jgi:hypothetical protein